MRNKKSPLLGRALTALVLLLLPSSYFAFQAPPDPEGRFKSIIEKKTGEKVKEPPPPPTTKKSSICVSDDIRFPNAISAQVFGARPLSESLSLKTFIPPRKPIPRKLFGFDENPTEYWFHNKIHTFGNTNVFGGLHAAVAPAATRLIDDLAYDGVDVRTTIAHDLRKAVNKTNACIIDLCCGVGMSTRALAHAFQDAQYICGIDTSPEMISMARCITKYNAIFNPMQDLFNASGNGNGYGEKHRPDVSFLQMVAEIRNTARGFTTKLPLSHLYPPACTYALGNAERILTAPPQTFDLVTIMYAFHEIPKSARSRILREARRLLAPGGTLAIVDICPEGYVPSPSMLAGEPYVLEYQRNVERQIEGFRGFHDLEARDVVPGLLRMWTLTRNRNIRNNSRMAKNQEECVMAGDAL